MCLAVQLNANEGNYALKERQGLLVQEECLRFARVQIYASLSYVCNEFDDYYLSFIVWHVEPIWYYPVKIYYK